MYFITIIEDLDPEWGTKGTRCIGYKKTFEEADQAVRENWCNINETIYNYAVIEFIGDGMYPDCLKRWFYKFNYDKRIYEPINEPSEVKHYCNFSIG